MSKDLGLSPEFKALKDQYDNLREELAKLAAEREILLTTVKRDLETKYYLKVGHKQYELFMLRNEVLRLKRKIELIHVCLNRGEEYDRELIENRLDEELRRWEEEVLELVQKIRQAEYINSLPLLTPAESRELRKLFRDLVRRLHPDINPDLPENNKSLWNRVLAAYDHGDLQELKTLALLAGDRKSAGWDLTALEELKATIEHVKERIHHLLRDLEKIEQQFPFNLREKLDCDAWVREQNEALAKQMGEYREQRLLYLSLLADLTDSSHNGGTLLH